MLADLSQPSSVMIAGAIVILLLVLLWVVMRTPGRWFAVLALGVFAAASGAGIFVYQSGYLLSGKNLAVNDHSGSDAEMESSEASDKTGSAADKTTSQIAELRRQESQSTDDLRKRARNIAEGIATKKLESVRSDKEKVGISLQANRGTGSNALKAPADDPSVKSRSALPPSTPSPDKETSTEKSATEDAAVETADKEGEEQWHVVPVFYGTDRNREDTDTRVTYGFERGKRLEVGRALVTVPKNHKVPNIERPWAYRIPLLNVVIFREKEDPAKHFTIRELKNLTEDEFIQLTRTQIGKSKTFKDQALVFVHGFNTTFDYAVYRAAQLSYDLDFDGGSFVYSWPSRGEVSAAAYRADREAVEQAAGYLEDFLALIAQKSGAKSLTVIAHSMGNKLLLPVLQKFKLRNDTDIKISQVIFAAPDVDRDTFAGLAREIKGLTQGGVTLYAASNDLALDASRQFWGGVARAGDVPADGPIVIGGVDTIDVTKTSTEIFSLNHAGYAQSKVILGDIRSLMLSGYRLPHMRNAKMLQLTTPAGGYWKYE